MYKFQTKSIPLFSEVHGLFGNFPLTYCSNNLFSGNTAPFSLSGTARVCLERQKLIWKPMLEIKSLWIDCCDTCWMDVELQSAGSLPCLSFQAASLHPLWKGWERASLQRSSAAWEWWGKCDKSDESERDFFCTTLIFQGAFWILLRKLLLESTDLILGSSWTMFRWKRIT